MVDMLEERLRSHSQAFDGLLSLIPGKFYYQEDNSTQWSKRKQSKEEFQRAKKAKLDPEAATSAAEIREKRLQKQKKSNGNAGGSEEEGNEDEDEDEDGDISGGSGSSSHGGDSSDGMDIDVEGDEGGEGGWQDVEDEEGHGNTPERKHGKKKQQDKVSKGGQKKKSAGKREETAEPKHNSKKEQKREGKGKAKGKGGEKKMKEKDDLVQNPSANGKMTEDEGTDGASDVHMTGFPDDTTQHGKSKPSAQPSDSAPSNPDLPNGNPSPSAADLRARLAARIEALRAQRKADHSDGTPARTRQELMEARRQKELQRKERKKQLRLQAKQEEEEKKKAAQKTVINGSGTPNGSIVASVSSRGNSEDRSRPVIGNNFAFGRVMFDDGAQLDATLQSVKGQKKRKGPMDALGALRHVQAKKARLEGMDAEKKGTVEEKEKWSRAMKQVNGEKVKDDEKLLKMTLKRQEQKKRKSEREWKDRREGVERAKAAKQKKREENLAARREQKKAGKAGKKATKVKAKKPKKGRPGFEGGLKSKTGGGSGGSGGKKR